MDSPTLPESFCIAPWKVLHISPLGDVRTCYESGDVMGNVHQEPLAEIWHGSKFKELRRQMLLGERIKQCEKCDIKAKALVGRSLRFLLNHQTIGSAATAQAFLAGSTEPELKPEVIDIAFSNVCNLRCRTCSSAYSTAWIPEEKKLGLRIPHAKSELSQSELQSMLYPYLGPPLKKILVAGGEPLFDPRYKELLNHIASSKSLEIAVETNTNGTYIDDELISLWNQLPSVRLSFSLDGFGHQFELIRTGAKWEAVTKNIRRVRSQCPKVQMICYSTISGLNLSAYPEFVEHILTEKLFFPDEITAHYLVEPKDQSIRNLDGESKRKMRTKYFGFMRDCLLLKHDFAQVQRLILQLKMILNFMEQPTTPHSV